MNLFWDLNYTRTLSFMKPTIKSIYVQQPLVQIPSTYQGQLNYTLCRTKTKCLISLIMPFQAAILENNQCVTMRHIANHRKSFPSKVNDKGQVYRHLSFDISMFLKHRFLIAAP